LTQRPEKLFKPALNPLGIKAASVVIDDLSDEVLIYGLARHEAHRLNRSAALVPILSQHPSRQMRGSFLAGSCPPRSGSGAACVTPSLRIHFGGHGFLTFMRVGTIRFARLRALLGSLIVCRGCLIVRLRCSRGYRKSRSSWIRL